MPRTFSSYLLPVFDVPVYHLGRELDRVDVPVSGDVEMSIPEQICKRLHKGELFVKPVTEVVSSNALHSLLIVSIMLAEMI